MSGLVVANSLLEKGLALQFLLSRFFRIWPGMMFVVLVTTLILGPALTRLDMKDYWSHASVMDYVTGNFLMDIRFDLPGVFDNLSYTSVNGSLWTLPYEVGAYVILLALFLLGAHKKIIFTFLLLFLFVIDPFLDERIIFSWRNSSMGADDFAPCFAFGVFLALIKDKLIVGLNWVFGFFILFIVFDRLEFSRYFFYASLFFLIIYIFSREWVLSFRLPADISYGVYLWGWPVQQILVYCFPDMGVQAHRFFSISLACFMGAVSWYLVEKPSIKFGGFFYKSIEKRIL